MGKWTQALEDICKGIVIGVAIVLASATGFLAYFILWVAV